MAERQFNRFKVAVAKQFESIKHRQLYRTDVEKDLLWLTYLESFPEGSNPIYKERTEHDCQSCKSFIRAVGSLVAWDGTELVSLWDCDPGEPYTAVAEAMAELVKSAPIKNVLLHDQKSAGVDKNFQDMLASANQVVTWEHFYIQLPRRNVNTSDRGTIYGERRSTMEVFKRALEEISLDALETVVELIEQGSLYRGEEHLHAVKSFMNLWKQYVSIEDERQEELFVWQQGLVPAVSRIRSTAIGTLLVDLSEGVDLDTSVKKFEAKVAPANYRRPKALVTKAMIERARKKVDELGFASALGRRFAVAEDITVNNVIFANRDARRSMGEDVFDELISEARENTKALDKVEEVPIEKFLEDIVPKVDSIELMLENRHAGNLVNLVAPRDPAAELLFKWGNGFSWCYAGELADSIKARVKTAGGDVSGDFRASLAWYNGDDLDIHLKGPGPHGGRYGMHVFYSNKVDHQTGCNLDVDMNAGGPTSRTPVENITFPQRSRMLEGEYELLVHQYQAREHRDLGFEIELEFDGDTFTFAYDQGVRQGQYVSVAKFRFTQKGGIEFTETLPRQNVQKELWGLTTQKFQPVSMIMLSPNHWNGRPVGNRHFFFMLQGCEREGSSRGFFNEYLKDDLREHRKVFELLGSKMRTEDEGPQLSGLGFSSTKRDSVYAKVAGAFTRTIKIVF